MVVGGEGRWGSSAAVAGVAVPSRGWYQAPPGKTVTQTLLQRNPLCQCTKKSVTSSQRNPVKSVQPVLHNLGPLSTRTIHSHPGIKFPLAIEEGNIPGHLGKELYRCPIVRAA